MDLTFVQAVLQTVTGAALLGVGKVLWSTNAALASLSASFAAHKEKDDQLDGLMLEEIRELRGMVHGKANNHS